MKKIWLGILFVVFIFLPIKVHAAQISSISITGETSKLMGEKVPITFHISVSGLEKGYDKTLGITGVALQIEYDENVLIGNSYDSPNFDSQVLTKDGNIYVISEAFSNSSSSNACGRGQLYCGDYFITIDFFIKDTELKNTTIKLLNVGVALFDMVDPNKEYTDDDIIELEASPNKTHQINIRDLSSPSEKPVSKPTTPPKEETPTKKSSNSLLKYLEIDHYKLTFDQNKKEYQLTVDHDTNSLTIRTTTDDVKADYKIIGADDLKANDYKVSIEVTAEDGTKTTYTISITPKEKQEETPVTPSENPKKKKEEKKIIDKKMLQMIGLGLGIFVLLIIIILLIRKFRDRKIDKLFDQL